VLVQAKLQTVQKVCKIIKKQLGLPDYSIVTGNSRFAMLGVDMVSQILPDIAIACV